MSIEFHGDPETGILTFSAAGVCSMEEFVTTVERAQGTPAYWPGVSILWDCRELDGSIMDDDAMREIVTFDEKHAGKRGRGRPAFVCSRDLEFGLLRMFQAFADRLPTEFRVFRDYEEATAWLLQTAAE